MTSTRSPGRFIRLLVPILIGLVSGQSVSGQTADPRVGLKAGWKDAGIATNGMALIGHHDKPAGFFDPAAPYGGGAHGNSDLAFRGNLVFQGNYSGFQIWDVSNPRSPKLRNTVTCPGNQGDPSVFGNLLFISIQATSGRLDCGPQGVTDTVSAERFRGVRIYDITDLDHPKVVAAVQTCRGSHTHTLVTDPNDKATLYVYVSGTSVVRSGKELAGCSSLPPDQDPNTSLFQIEVIRVPLAAPHEAKIVTTPRIFADEKGAIAGLAKAVKGGPDTQETSETNQCHDITAYPELGIAAGACSGNGILIDIRDPAHPKRITEVSDPNFAYWHSATFNNDATTLVFTDEWGGGSAPRCRSTDKPEWGANAIYSNANGKLTQASFFKLPAAQTEQENCVAHNGSLIPVPGRDLFVQSWYQGGISIMDFTDPRHPFEVGYFDRGPVDAAKAVQAGQWSSYWYNGLIYGSEIARGLDILELKPNRYLSQNEIDAAKLVRFDQFNAQLQPKIVWPAAFVVARAYLDQLVRNDGLRAAWAAPVRRSLDQAERLEDTARRTVLTTLARQLEKDAASAGDPDRVRKLAAVLIELAK
jgi:hypothetical protein